MVVCMHTMGQSGRTFTEKELAKAKHIAKKLSEALERSEQALWQTEATRHPVEQQVKWWIRALCCLFTAARVA
jgi:hypothetical protein